MNNKKYYFITVFHSYDEFGPHDGRCWGFYSNWDDANEVLHNNMIDLWETCYHYGVIEEYTEGISTYTGRRWFYIYNRESNKYELTNCPKILEHYDSFSIG